MQFSSQRGDFVLCRRKPSCMQPLFASVDPSNHLRVGEKRRAAPQFCAAGRSVAMAFAGGFEGGDPYAHFYGAQPHYAYYAPPPQPAPVPQPAAGKRVVAGARLSSAGRLGVSLGPSKGASRIAASPAPTSRRRFAALCWGRVRPAASESCGWIVVQTRSGRCSSAASPRT